LVLGSATPLISEYYVAQQKQRPIITISTLATAHTTVVQQHVVDIKDRSLFDSSVHLSRPLVQAIQTALARKEQTMLYLNRRGTARIALCLVCGWQALCPRCDLPLTYHGDSHQLLCHTCGFRDQAVSSCPVCGNSNLVFRSAGTKAIADEASRLFPQARIRRFDTDNLKADRFEQHYEAIKNQEVDILVGTQLLAKGLDLPMLTTLWVVLADSSLAIPDFTSQERTYQLITQVLGRVGRGHAKHGTAIIQTAQPDNPIITAALTGDWSAFYNQEIKERQQFRFPPFCYLLKLSCRRASAEGARRAAANLKQQLHKLGLSIEVDGPTPSFHEKLGNTYEWQLVVRSKSRSSLLEIIKVLPRSGWSFDIDPINLL
jgi:primosomal protein N' (replication factor Y)